MKKLLIGLMAAMMVACTSHTVKPVVVVTPPDTKTIVSEHWTLEVPIHMNVVQENHSTKAMYKDSTTGLITLVRTEKLDRPLEEVVFAILSFVNSDEQSKVLSATPVTWLGNDAARIVVKKLDALAFIWITVGYHQATSLVCGAGDLSDIETQKVCDNIASHFALK